MSDGVEVARVETPFQEASVAEMLRLALLQRTPDLHQDQAALLLAQLAIETARGKSCQNFNVGNLSANEHMAGAYYRPVWYEITPSSSALLIHRHEQMLRGEAPRAFRAFDNFSAGVAAYVSVARALGVVDAAASGNAERTAEQISRHYTPGADVPALTRALDAIRGEFLKRGLFETLPKERASPGRFPD